MNVIKSKNYWNALFQSIDKEKYYSNPLPKELKEAVESLPRGGLVLDLGCGMAGASVHLSEMGFRVTAVDISDAAISLLKAECDRRGLEIDARTQDVCHFQFETNYHLVIAYGLLQFLSKKNRDHLIYNIKKHTKPCGLNFIMVFTNVTPMNDNMVNIMGETFKEGELFDYYKDWTILKKKRYEKEETHKDGINKKYTFNMVMATK